MKTLRMIVAAGALLGPTAEAQAGFAASVNVGPEFPTDTLALEITVRGGCGFYHSTTCLDVTGGVARGLNHAAVYDLLEGDVGYSIAFGAAPRTSLVLRVGISTWIRDDHTGALGVNSGIAFRGLIRPTVALRVDYTWRSFAVQWPRGPWFTWPSLTVGLEKEMPPSN